MLLDKVTKDLVLTFRTEPGLITEVTSFFNLVLVYNRGVSFGLFQQTPGEFPYLLFALVGSLLVLLLFFIARARDLGSLCAFSLIFAGGIANLTDRIGLPGVVDFLDFHLGGYHWPAFNVADMAICLGVFLYLGAGFWKSKKDAST